MSAIVNATSLIALAVVNRLDLLSQIFGEVIVPTAVYQEVVSTEMDRPGAQIIAQAKWLKVMSPQAVPTLEPILLGLDAGEIDVLLLAREQQPDWVIIDERQARRVSGSSFGSSHKGDNGRFAYSSTGRIAF
jgi:predicted nucleic acid-binding protein